MIVKICNTHGELTINDVIKKGVTNNIQRYKCKECQKVLRKNNYIKNKDKICARVKLNAKLSTKPKKQYPSKNNYRNPVLIKKRERKTVDNLYDSYVIKLIKRNSTIQRDIIPQEMITLKRDLVLLRRKIRELNYGKNT